MGRGIPRGMPGRGLLTDASLTAMMKGDRMTGERMTGERMTRERMTRERTGPELVVPTLVVVVVVLDASGLAPVTSQRRIYGHNIPLRWYVMSQVPP